MNKRRMLQTVLVVLALLMPVSAMAWWEEKPLMDTDFQIKGIYVESKSRGGFSSARGFSQRTDLFTKKMYGHFTLYEDRCVIQIPAFQTEITDTFKLENVNAHKKPSSFSFSGISAEGACGIGIWEMEDEHISEQLRKEVEKIGSKKYYNVVLGGKSILSTDQVRIIFDWRRDVHGDLMNMLRRSGDYTLTMDKKQFRDEEYGGTFGYRNDLLIFDYTENGYSFSFRILCKKLNATNTHYTSDVKSENYVKYYVDGPVETENFEVDDEVELSFFGVIPWGKVLAVSEDGVESYEEDNMASDESGIGNAVKYLIPIGVAGAILYKRKRKNKKKGQNEENNEDEEEEEEEDQLEMEIYKDFGDTLTVGDAAQWVYVCIVRKNSKSPEWTDLNLTRQIQVEGDGYLSVEDGGIKNDWKCVAVGAPECEGEAPEEGFVKFTLANEYGSYVNRVHFKIVKGAIIFDPDLSNVTIPAHFQQPVSVPFEVVGIDEKADMELTVTMEDANGNITSDYDVELDPRNPLEDKPNYAIIHDRKLDEKTDYLEAGTHLSYVLHVRASSGENLVIDGYMPVFRYYMGLSLKVPDGGVGCYVEEYNPEKHFIHSFFKVDGKQFARCQTKCFVKIYDYDLEKHCILAKEPHPDNIDLKVEGVGDDVKDMLERINLSITGVPRGEEGFYYFLFCRTDVLAPPNRLAVLATLTVKDGENKYVVKQVLNLWSQPRRSDLTPEQMQAAIKRDDELEARLLKVDNKITEIGLRDDFDKFLLSAQRQQEGIDTPLVISDRLELFGVDRFHKLLKSIEILQSTRDSNFGYDEDSVVAVETLFHNYMRKRQIVYEREQTEAEIEMKEAMAPAGVKEYLYNRHKAFSEMNLIESMLLGVVTCGFSELLTTGVAVGAGMYKEAEEGKGDNLFLDVWFVGAKTVTINYLMEKGVKGAIYVAKSAGSIAVAFGNKFDNVFNLKKLKDKTFKEKVAKLWTATKEGARKANLERKRTLGVDAVKKEVKEAVKDEINSVTKIKSGFRTLTEIKENFNKATDTANDLLYKAKTMLSKPKDVIPDSAVKKAGTVLEAIKGNPKRVKLDDVMEKANKRAEKKLLELERLMNESRDAFASPEVAQKHLKLVLEIQSDKHAMNMLNSFKGLNRLKNDMNVTLRQVYRDVDSKVIKRLSQITGIPEGDIMPMNATGSALDDLISGKKVTYDRDITYYYKNTDGKWCYFDQAGTEKLYDLELQRTAINWTGEKGMKYGTAEAASKFGVNKLDQTIIEDVLNHVESYGEDLEKMIKTEFHRQNLSDPKKVAKTIYNKGMHQIEQFSSLMKQAGSMAGEAAEDMQIKALACLKEGCRQNVKTFKLVASRQAARADIVGQQISASLYEGIAVLEKFTKGEASPDQVEMALGLLGYTYESLTKELSSVAEKVG